MQDAEGACEAWPDCSSSQSPSVKPDGKSMETGFCSQSKNTDICLFTGAGEQNRQIDTEKYQIGLFHQQTTAERQWWREECALN